MPKILSDLLAAGGSQFAEEPVAATYEEPATSDEPVFTEATTEAPGTPTELVHLSIDGWRFTIPKSRPLIGPFRAYRKRLGLETSQMFMVGGVRIFSDDTAESFGLKNGDDITALTPEAG